MSELNDLLTGFGPMGSPQPGVFQLGLLEQGDIVVGILPEREELLVSRFGPDVVPR